jgi:hypothetical protein
MTSVVLDEGIMISIFWWYLHGLYPGSCAAHIINNDRMMAERSAHYLIRERKNQKTSSVLDNHFTIFKELYDWFWIKGVTCDDWHSVGGFYKADEVIKMEHRLMIPEGITWAKNCEDRSTQASHPDR